MAKDVRFLISANADRAERELQRLQRSGGAVAHAMERDFAALGTRSSLVFDEQRKSAKKAFENIKQSSFSTTRDIEQAQRGLAKRLKQIDEEQYGKRLGLAQAFRANIGKVIAAGAGAVAYGAFRVGKEAIDEAGDFESALVSLGKVGVKDLGAVREAIMDLPDELGGATELVEGYYQAISSGVTEPKRALDLLKTAAMAGKAAGVEQGEVIKALTKLMAGYGDEIASAEEASDLLFSMERFGQTNVAELVPVIGGLASLSAQLNVIPQEMGAVMAAITQTAGSTSQAATQYQAIMSNLIKPTEKMRELFEEIGVDSAQQLISDQGLTGALRTIKQAAEDSFGPAGLGRVFESKEAITALGPLFADNFGQVNETIKAMGDNAGATREAFDQYSNTWNALKDTFNNTVGKVMIELGTELMPTVKEAMTELGDWLRENKDDLIAFASDMLTIISGTAKAIGAIVNAVSSQADAGTAGWMEREEQLMRDTAGSGESSLFEGMPSSYAVGTSYVPRTGMYQLHRGEQVQTRSEVQRSQAPVTISPTLNFTVNESQAPQTTAREVARAVEAELRKMGARYATS